VTDESLALSSDGQADQGEMISCPQCISENPAAETYCAACGSALHDEGAISSLSLLAVGTVLADHYVVESGESHGQENRYRASVLISSAANNESEQVLLRERRSEEASALQVLAERTVALQHPSVLVPRQYLESDGRGYLVCPDVAGIRLSERIGRTSEREAITWGVQLCQMLAFLHSRELLCVELPPDNLLLDKEGRLRLWHLDAIRAEGDVHENSVVTDGFAAPEVYKANGVGALADVFAVAACLYTLMVGKRLAVEGWVVQPEVPVFYPEKTLSAGLERVLRKALASNPSDRYDGIEPFKMALLTLNQTVAISSAWITDVGQVRDHNEDAVLVKEQGQGTIAGDDFVGLYVVSDGMGGAEAGEVASALTIATIGRRVEQIMSEHYGENETAWEDSLCAAVQGANASIMDYAKQHPQATGLGATVVAALVHAQRLTLAWVGDSRAYLWEQGRLEQLSRDHSLVERLVEIGQLTPEEARTHEHRNVLIRSLGSKEQVVVDSLTRPLRRGARFMLCSDGLTSHVEDHALADILSRHRDPRDAALEFVAAANTGGGSDNVSVVVVFHE
jgi:serine/threonine protein phosphatase PrpC